MTDRARDGKARYQPTPQLVTRSLLDVYGNPFGGRPWYPSAALAKRLTFFVLRFKVLSTVLSVVLLVLGFNERVLKWGEMGLLNSPN